MLGIVRCRRRSCFEFDADHTCRAEFDHEIDFLSPCSGSEMVQSGSWVYESGLRTDLGGGEGIEEATDEVTVVEYELELLTGPPWEGSFTSEVNFSYPVPAQVSGVSSGDSSGAVGYTIIDLSRKTTQGWSWEPKASVTFKEGCLTPRWGLVLNPGEIWRSRVSLALRRED